MLCMYVLQTSGATSLFIASQEGNVECVRALLAGGATINQAKVVDVESFHDADDGGQMRCDPWEPLCMTALRIHGTQLGALPSCAACLEPSYVVLLSPEK
jgi:hypothetical protein